jgi:hypothetical protein
VGTTALPTKSIQAHEGIAIEPSQSGRTSSRDGHAEDDEATEHDRREPGEGSRPLRVATPSPEKQRETRLGHSSGEELRHDSQEGPPPSVPTFVPLVTREGGSACGGQTSDTAPAKCTGGSSPVGPTVLTHGVDSLYLSFRCALTQTALSTLEDAKESAMREGRPALVKLAGLPFEVADHGVKWFHYILSNEFMAAKVSRNTSENAVQVAVELRSVTLWQKGVTEAWRLAETLVASVSHGPAKVHVTRSDLAVDVIGVPFEDADIREFSSRGRGRGGRRANEDEEVVEDDALNDWQTQYASHRVTGFTLGRSGIKACLYNKTRELKKSGKDWFRSIWGQRADGQEVWRVEVRFMREGLKTIAVERGEDSLDLDSCEGFVAALPFLWRYATNTENGWLQWKKPGENRQRTRWESRPEWDVIAAAPWTTTKEGYEVVRTAKKVATFEQLIPGFVGYMTTLAATREIAEFDRALAVIGAAAEGYLVEKNRTFRGEVERKAIRVNVESDALLVGPGR